MRKLRSFCGTCREPIFATGSHHTIDIEADTNSLFATKSIVLEKGRHTHRRDPKSLIQSLALRQQTLEKLTLDLHDFLQILGVKQLPRIIENHFHIPLCKGEGFLGHFSCRIWNHGNRLVGGTKTRIKCPFCLPNGFFSQFAYRVRCLHFQR